MPEVQDLMMDPRLAAVGLVELRMLLAIADTRGSDGAIATPELRRMLQRSPSEARRLAVGLASKGLVRRQRAGRAVFIALTPEGRKVVAYARKLMLPVAQPRAA